MTNYLKSTDHDLWDIIEQEYNVLPSKPTDTAGLKAFQLDLTVIDKLYGALDEKTFEMIDGLETAKAIWEKLEQ